MKPWQSIVKFCDQTCFNDVVHGPYVITLAVAELYWYYSVVIL